MPPATAGRAGEIETERRPQRWKNKEECGRHGDFVMKIQKKLLQNDKDSKSMEDFKHLNYENQSISSLQNPGRSHKSLIKTQEHETNQGKWITRSKGGSQIFLEIWENVAGATIGDYLVNPRTLN